MYGDQFGELHLVIVAWKSYIYLTIIFISVLYGHILSVQMQMSANWALLNVMKMPLATTRMVPFNASVTEVSLGMVPQLAIKRKKLSSALCSAQTKLWALEIFMLSLLFPVFMTTPASDLQIILIASSCLLSH